MFMEKFTRFFQDQETIDDWCNTWGEHLSGISGEQIKFALEKVSSNCEWPPTLHEFRQWCEAMPKPDLPKIEAPKHGISPHAEQCLREIAMILSKPKPDPRAWKQQVLDRAALGEHVSLSAMELAQTSFYK